jgi:adenylate cyclase
VSGETASLGRDPAAVQVPNASGHIFISYASQDAAVANVVVESLERQGIKCWIAPRDVVPGALYADEIVRAINEARVVVIILSEQAVASPHVGKEIERASSKRRRIVALRTDSVSLPRAFEYFLSESQWIDAGSTGINEAAARLVDAVRRYLSSSAALESPAPPAAELLLRRATMVSRRKWLPVGIVAAVLLALVYLGVEHYWRPKQAGIAALAQTVKQAPATPAASIAVLAFSDLSPEGNQAYFSDGVAEEILNVLAHINGLKVASRTSSFQYRKSDLSAPEIAKKLGVHYILEGSVRKAGETVRITAQLIDASTDQHEWSQTFDRPLNTANLFAIQDEIAKSIVEHLAAKVGSAADVAGPTVRKPETADEDAYDLYLKGRSLFIARSKQNLIEAARVLTAAVARDPKFARAWEMLGAVLVIGKSWNVGDERDYQAGVDALDTALRLDPNLSLAYAVRGVVHGYLIPIRGAAEWEEAFDNLAHAIDNDGTNATAYLWRAEHYAALGYFERAIQDYQRCLEIDPAHEVGRRHLAIAYYYLGRTDDALRLVERGLENGYFFNDVQLLPTVAARGDRIGALSILAVTYRDHPELIRPLFRALTDPTFSDLDRRDAVALVKDAKNVQEFVPMALLILKDYDNIVLADDDPPVWWSREDAAWLGSQGRKQAMQHWHLPEYWRKHGFPPQCRPIGESDFECR